MFLWSWGECRVGLHCPRSRDSGHTVLEIHYTARRDHEVACSWPFRLDSIISFTRLFHAFEQRGGARNGAPGQKSQVEEGRGRRMRVDRWIPIPYLCRTCMHGRMLLGPRNSVLSNMSISLLGAQSTSYVVVTCRSISFDGGLFFNLFRGQMKKGGKTRRKILKKIKIKKYKEIKIRQKKNHQKNQKKHG